MEITKKLCRQSDDVNGTMLSPIAEESRQKYLRAKLIGATFVSLVTVLFGVAVVQYLTRPSGMPGLVAGGVAMVLVWGAFLAIPTLLRRQRARLYENEFYPPHKPVSHFLTGRDFSVARDAVREAEYYHDPGGHPHFRVVTEDGRTFLFTPADSGREFFERLGDYFSVVPSQ